MSSARIPQSHELGSNEVVEDLIASEALERSRERNREHAKKTRMRKKWRLEAMKEQLLKLQSEADKLQRVLEQNNTANILLCMGLKKNPGCLDDDPDGEPAGVDSATANGLQGEWTQTSTLVSDAATGTGTSASSSSSRKRQLSRLTMATHGHQGNLVDQLRQKVRQDAAAQTQASGGSPAPIVGPHGVSSGGRQRSFSIGSADGSIDGSDGDGDGGFMNVKGSINWRLGTLTSESGVEHQLSQAELDHLRRERNRMHAKLTRSRKKMFMSEIKQTIDSLELANSEMREQVSRATRWGKEIASPPGGNKDKDYDYDRKECAKRSGKSSWSPCYDEEEGKDDEKEPKGDGEHGEHNDSGDEYSHKSDRSAVVGEEEGTYHNGDCKKSTVEEIVNRVEYDD